MGHGHIFTYLKPNQTYTGSAGRERDRHLHVWLNRKEEASGLFRTLEQRKQSTVGRDALWWGRGKPSVSRIFLAERWSAKESKGGAGQAWWTQTMGPGPTRPQTEWRGFRSGQTIPSTWLSLNTGFCLTDTLVVEMSGLSHEDRVESWPSVFSVSYVRPTRGW